MPKGVMKLVFLHPPCRTRSDDRWRSNLAEPSSRSLVQISEICAHSPFVVPLIDHDYIS
jgi:hypothetical protein